MSIPPQPNAPAQGQGQLAVELSDAERDAVAVYAQAHGLTPDEAATALVQMALVNRHQVRRLTPAQVVPFPARRCVAQQGA